MKDLEKLKKLVNTCISAANAMNEFVKVLENKEIIAQSNLYDYFEPSRVPITPSQVKTLMAGTDFWHDVLGETSQDTTNNVRRVLREANVKKRRYSEGYRYYIKLIGAETETDKSTPDRQLVYDFLQSHIIHTGDFIPSTDLIKQLRKTNVSHLISTPRQLGQYLGQWAINGMMPKKDRINGQYGYYIKIIK